MYESFHAHDISFFNSSGGIQSLLSDEDGILAVDGAKWFVDMLSRIPGLQIDNELCQEDWGVAIRARRDGKKFWIGLSFWPDGENAWLAHFHHGSFAWLQRISPSGKRALNRLVSDVHNLLANDPLVSNIVWYDECEMTKASPTGFATPT